MWTGTGHWVCQDIALRAVHESVVQEHEEEGSTVVSSEEVTLRAVLGIAAHAVAVVRDQVDSRELGEVDDQTFFGSNGATGLYHSWCVYVEWTCCCSGNTVHVVA